MPGLTKTQLTDTISEIVNSILDPRLKELQEQQSDVSKTLTDAFRGLGGKAPAPVKEPGADVARTIIALAKHKGDPGRAIDFIEKRYGTEGNEKILNSFQKALAAGDGVAGGFLLSEDFSSEVIELLRPLTVVRGSSPIIQPMPQGSFTMPGLATGSQANYEGENQNAPKTEPTFRQVKLTYKKLIALVPISNDLLRYSTANSEAVVRDDLVAAMSQREDLAFLRGDGLDDTPKGMRNFAIPANVLTQSGVAIADIIADLSAMLTQMAEANVRMIRPYWFMSPRSAIFLQGLRDADGYVFRDEMLRGSLWGIPFKTSTQIPNNLGGGTESEVILADMADMVIGDSMNITIDASGEAAYHDGTALQAAFSRDQTVIRAIAAHDFNVRHVESIVVLTAVTWGV